VRLHSTRPDVAAALLHGRTGDELCAAVPRLFALCGASQGVACALACAAASGAAPASDVVARGNAATAAEIVRESSRHWLLDAPRFEGDTVPPGALLAARRAAHWHLGDAAGSSAIALAAFGMPAGEWLALRTLDELDAWIDADAPAVSARALRRVRDEAAGWPADAGAVALLPAQDGAVHIGEWLPPPGAEAPFARQPVWRGQPAETGALARQQHDVLVAALLQRGVHRVLTRGVARLRELARLLTGEAPPLAGVIPAPPGTGIAWADNARGLLVHQVQLAEGRSLAYRIVAPTEWNFHPQGAVPRSLQGAPAADADAARRLAGRLINSLDPCVAWQVGIDDA